MHVSKYMQVGKDERKEGWEEGRKDGVKKDGWEEGRKDGRKDGWEEGKTEGRMGGRKVGSILFITISVDVAEHSIRLVIRKTRFILRLVGSEVTVRFHIDHNTVLARPAIRLVVVQVECAGERTVYNCAV